MLVKMLEAFLRAVEDVTSQQLDIDKYIILSTFQKVNRLLKKFDS